MFKKKIHLILLLLSLFFIPSVMAWQTATFSDYTSSKNFTFTGSGNNTFYISLPKNATILGASVNVSGFLYKSGTDGVSISDSTNFIVKYGSTATTQLNYTHWNTSFILEEKDYSNSHTTALNVTLSNSYPKTAQAYDSTGSPISSTIDGDKIKWTSESMQASVAEYKNDTGTSAGTYMCNTHDCASPQSWSNFYADEMYVRWYHGVNCEGSPSIYVKYDSYYTATINLNCTASEGWTNTAQAGLTLLPLTYPHYIDSYTMSSAGYDVGKDAAGYWMIRAEAINFARTQEYVLYSIWGPNNTYLDTGGNGNKDWQFGGEFIQSNNRTADFSSEVNNYLPTCSNDPCDVPFVLHSDSAGIIQVSDISITYIIPQGQSISLTGITNHTNGTSDTIVCSGNITSNLYQNHTSASAYNNTPTVFAVGGYLWTCNTTFNSSYIFNSISSIQSITSSPPPTTTTIEPTTSTTTTTEPPTTTTTTIPEGGTTTTTSSSTTTTSTETTTTTESTTSTTTVPTTTTTFISSHAGLQETMTIFIGGLGVTVSQLLAILTTLGCIIFMAKDLRLGLMFLFMFSAVEFIGLYTLQQDTTLHVIMMLVSLATLILSYLITHKKTQSPFDVT